MPLQLDACSLGILYNGSRYKNIELITLFRSLFRLNLDFSNIGILQKWLFFYFNVSKKHYFLI